MCQMWHLNSLTASMLTSLHPQVSSNVGGGWPGSIWGCCCKFPPTCLSVWGACDMWRAPMCWLFALVSCKDWLCFPSVATRWSATAKWIQLRPHSLKWGTWMPVCFPSFSHRLYLVMCSCSLPLCPPQMADAGGLPQLTQVINTLLFCCLIFLFVLFCCCFGFKLLFRMKTVTPCCHTGASKCIYTK